MPKARIKLYSTDLDKLNKVSSQIIDIAEKVSKKKKIDAIILSRGGGSLEDLWVFNEKEL